LINQEEEMNDIKSARDALSNSLGYFADYLQKVNDWIPSASQYRYPSIFPTVSPQAIKQLAADINSSNTSFTDKDFTEYVKNDFGNVGPNKGHIEFKSLAWLIQNNPQYTTGSGPTKKIKPVPIFTWPPEKTDDTGTYKMVNWGWGVDLLLELGAFTLDYDFVTYPDYYQFIFNDLKIALNFKSIDPANQNHKELRTVWKTPAMAMTVEVRIPKNLAVSVSLPDITFDFFGFIFNLNPNFNWGNFNFSPLRLNFPDWLNWPFDPISIGDFLKLNIDCGYTIGLILPDGPRFKLNVNWGKIKLSLLNLLKFLGFNPSGSWPILPDYFTEVQPKDDSPEWAAIYFDLSKLTEVMGGFKPYKLFFLMGVHKSGHIKAGFLTCTGKIQSLQDKSFMLRSALQYDFELPENNGKELKAHPGFSLEILSGKDAQDLATAASCTPPSCPPPSAAEVTFGSFAARLDRLGLLWDKDENDYVCFADGEFAIKKLLRSKDPLVPDGDLKLPFKGLGFTPGGKMVLKKSWVTLREAQQVKLDDIKAVQLFLRAYGYAKESSGKFWIGFSGDLKLPVLNVTAGVDNLLFWSDGTVELSGVNIDTEIANGVLHLKGAVKWGQALMPPHLAGSSAKVSGFAGLLKLGISASTFGLDVMLGFTYVKIVLNSQGNLIAWSFAGDVTLPTTIELGCGIGIRSLGMMVGQNYLPLPKQNKVPYDRWLEAGLNNDAENILDVVNYWTPAQEAFAAGFSIGLGTTMDNSFILKAKAMLVLAVPGPLIVIAGKADVLSKKATIAGMFNLLIIYDHDDPGILASLSFRYDVKNVVSIYGMAELYFDFEEPNRWHFYLGTPAKPVSAKALGIFEAGAYLTIDAYKLAVGVNVFYGYNWDVGPLYIKAYIAFSGELLISWNPAFIQITLKLVGELAAKIFGFGLSAGLSANLLIKAPVPWYLYAAAEARFSISLLFFSWSFTASLEFSWGDDILPAPPVVLPLLFDEVQRFKALAGSLRTYTSLTPDGFTPQSNPVKRFLPMDGVLALEFTRDIEFVLDQQTKALFKGSFAQTVKDEKSPNASNYQAFHGRVTDFKIEKSTNGSTYATITKPVYFVWTPTDETKRKRLITREFDRGYCQFRLNDDPNAFVKLTCPDLFQTDNALIFDTENPDLRGTFTFKGALKFECQQPWIKVRLSQDQTGSGPETYQLDYAHFGARLYTNGVIPLVAQGGGDQAIALEDGMTLELDVPSTCIYLLYSPKTLLPAGTQPAVRDLLSLYDEDGNDITAKCDNKVFSPTAPYVFILNDFDEAQNPQPRVYSAQDPPTRGVKKIVFKDQGFIWFMKKPGTFFTLFPLEAIDAIYQRNLARVRQKAKLEYTFEQNKNPGKILWAPGDYRLAVKTDWYVNQNQAVEPKSFSEAYSVIKPFEHQVVQVNEEPVEVQPFDPYLRQLVPADGERPVYRHLLPAITYRCNYINAMLQEGKRRLAMVFVDSNDNPCRYTRIVANVTDLDLTLAEDMREFGRNFAFEGYRDLEAVKEKLPKDIPGVPPELVEEVLGQAFPTISQNGSPKKGQTAEKPQIHLFTAAGQSLVHEAHLLRLNRLVSGDAAARQRAAKLEKTLTQRFAKAEDQALVAAVEGRYKIIRLRFKSGIVEYRYTNNDLKLDVSNLQLSHCLKPGEALELNGYERGFFAPVLPADAFWSGFKPNTRYTAKIYALDDNETLKDKLPADPAVHSFHFTTSLFGDIEGLGQTFAKTKSRQIVTTPAVYTALLSDLTADLQHQKFDHPADPQGTKIDFGLDIFRQLAAKPPVNATAGVVPRDLEEKFQQMYETGRKELKKSRQAEGLVFAELFEKLNLKPDPVSPQGVKVTWLKTLENGGKSYGTLGLMIDFPEPVDWERTGIQLGSFKIRVAGESEELDMQNLPQNNPSYAHTLHWIRSLDGTRLVLVPILTRTRTYHPYVVLPKDDLLDRPDFPIEGLTRLEDAVTLAGESILDRPADEIAPSAGITPTTESEDSAPAEAVFSPAVFIGDYSVTTPPLTSDMADIARVRETFGKTVVENISTYQVTQMELKFYYLSDNYEKKNRNFRGITRLTFLKGQPGDAKGFVATLKL
jgi:hypothetical protein